MKDRMERKAILENQKSNIYTLIFLGIITLISISFIIFGTIRTEAAPTEERYKYYTSVSIQKGDTLWSIAKDYQTSECGSIRDYIDEICKLNHITEDMIHEGQFITIPYYSSEYK